MITYIHQRYTFTLNSKKYSNLIINRKGPQVLHLTLKFVGIQTMVKNIFLKNVDSFDKQVLDISRQFTD